MQKNEEEPLSPMARVFQSPGIDLCALINIGFKTKINPDVVLDALKQNVYKHPRNGPSSEAKRILVLRIDKRLFGGS
ncbi:unnamed protein product [Arabidopsis lyrata]|nr:unnamed protein product [Arabidopsis lyrata]